MNNDKYNSHDLEPDTILSYLIAGLREPQNEYERGLLAEINEIKASGKIVDIPFN